MQMKSMVKADFSCFHFSILHRNILWPLLWLENWSGEVALTVWIHLSSFCDFQRGHVCNTEKRMQLKSAVANFSCISFSVLYKRIQWPFLWHWETQRLSWQSEFTRTALRTAEEAMEFFYIIQKTECNWNQLYKKINLYYKK